MIRTAWNLSNVMAALGKLSVTPLMKAGLMSMHTSLIASRSPPWGAWATPMVASCCAPFRSMKRGGDRVSPTGRRLHPSGTVLKQDRWASVDQASARVCDFGASAWFSARGPTPMEKFAVAFP
jgi:hypothetical protein